MIDLTEESIHHDGVDATAQAVVSGTGEPRRGPFGLSGADLAVVALATVLLVGNVKLLYSPAWTLRFAVVLAVAPVGAAALVRQVRRRDSSAVFAVGLIGAAVASAVASSTPLLSLLGPIGSDASALLYACVLLLWAYGRSLDARSIEVVQRTVVGGCVANVLYGALQILFDVQGGSFNAFPGRASGFLQNPAYFSSVVVGALGWAAVRAVQRHDHLSRILVALFAFGVGLSGARVALGLAILGLALAALIVREREVLVVGVAGAVGVLAALAMTSTSEAPAAASTVERFATKGADGRLALWQYDFAAWRERPVFGWGLARHASAVQGRYGLAFTRSSALDDVAQPWDDPHNIVVLLAVSLGAVGLILACLFAVTALRSVRDLPLTAMAVLIGATWLVQPASIHSMPLALLILGAASAPSGDRWATGEPPGRPSRHRLEHGFLAAWVVTIVGVIVLPSALLRQAIVDTDAGRAAAAARWFPADPGAADAVAGLYANYGRDSTSGTKAMIAWSQRAVDRDPHRPLWRTNMALRQMLLEDYEGAAANLDEALRLQPWNVGALDATYYLAILTGDDSAQARADAKLCLLLPASCTNEVNSPGAAAGG